MQIDLRKMTFPPKTVLLLALCFFCSLRTPAVKASPPRQLSPRDMTRDVIPPPPPPPFTLLSGQDNLHDALIKIGQLSAGSNLVAPGKQHQTSIQQVMHIDPYIYCKAIT